MDFGIKEARELLADPILWPRVRDYLKRGGEFKRFPRGVKERLCLLDEATLTEIRLWCEALSKVDEWRAIVDGEKVRELKAAYPGIYPEVFRYAPYFARFKPLDPTDEAVILQVLKLKFPEVYTLCS